jgi:hypothetical protein
VKTLPFLRRAPALAACLLPSGLGLYRDSTITAYCLGAHHGTGFFEQPKFYRSAAPVYSLSRWSAGWHVDRIDVQP